MKSCLAIYNLNGKVTRQWRDLNHTKKDAVKEIRWSNVCRIFQDKYMSERYFDRNVIPPELIIINLVEKYFDYYFIIL